MSESREQVEIHEAVERGYVQWEKESQCGEPSCGCVTVYIEREIAPILARALAACALKSAKPLLAYAHHKAFCVGFPAFSEEQLARDCNCGLQAIKTQLAALERAAGEKS